MRRCLRRVLCSAPVLTVFLLAPSATVQAQFNYITNNGAITITGYSGPGGNVTIPETVDGLPVTCIGPYAFYALSTLTSVTIPPGVTTIDQFAFSTCPNIASVNLPDSVTEIGNGAFNRCSSLTSVTLPARIASIGWAAFSATGLSTITIADTVTNLGSSAFSYCSNLTAIVVDALNAFYRSVDGVLFDKNQANLRQFPGAKAGDYAVPNTVTNIVGRAFAGSQNLVTLLIPDSVRNIAVAAFADSPNLTSVYFAGDCPTADQTIFSAANNVIVYYFPGATGWGATFARRPTVLWNPQAQTNDAYFGVHQNGFGFTITGTSNLVIVVEACTNLAAFLWSALSTNTLTGGFSCFTDPQWTNYPARFYRIRSP